MRLCPDKTGRFSMRPYYDNDELDRLCEQAIEEFMEEHYGGLKLPIPTDALTKLLDRDTEDLDLYANLSSYGAGVDGLTQFHVGRKPRVRVSSELGALLGHGRREHRLRTTLSHEHGHVMLHRRLYESKTDSPKMLEDLARSTSPVCKRDGMIEVPGKNWMEWQASHCCSALLIPITHLNKLVSEHFERLGIYGGSVRKDTSQAGELIHMVSKVFFVSREAAKVRLNRLDYLVDHDVGPSLFNT